MSNDKCCLFASIVLGDELVIKRLKVLEESNAHLEQEVQDMKVILPTRFVENTQKSSVMILNPENEGVGVGFYISENVVITCAHNFPELESKTLEQAKLLILYGLNFSNWFTAYTISLITTNRQ
jgi:hypothetical protein